MKKIVGLGAGLCLALSACADEAGNEDNTATEAESAAEEADAGDVDKEEEAENAAEAEADSDAAETAEPAPEVAAKPVRFGIDGENFDSCAGSGDVTGLDPNGDNFLSVRSAPSTSAKELDRLPAGTTVAMCDSSAGWVGIVYDTTGQKDCGTGSPIDGERNYDGPCKSGWVSEKFITLMAG